MKQAGKQIDETAANTVSYLSGDRSLCHVFVSQARSLRVGQEGVCLASEALISLLEPLTQKCFLLSRVLQWTPVVCLHVLPARGEQRVHERGDRAAPAHLPDHRGAHPHGPVLPLALPRYPAPSSPGGRILLNLLAILIVGNISSQANQSFHFQKNLYLRMSVRPCDFLTWSLCESYVDANTEFIWFRTHSYIGNYLLFYFKNQGWVGVKT